MKKVNTVNWFEIPTIDLERAKKFYETVFKVKLEEYDTPSTKMYTFPAIDKDSYGAMGALVYNEDLKPSKDGTTVYFYCENLENEISRIEPNGGKIILPKTNIGENGFIAQCIDTEGNKIAVHSYPQ